MQTAANSLLGMNPVAIFCSNEGAVTGFLAAVSDGEDLAEGGKYAGLVVANGGGDTRLVLRAPAGFSIGVSPGIVQDTFGISLYCPGFAVCLFSMQPMSA